MDLKTKIIYLLNNDRKEEAFKFLKARYILSEVPELLEATNAHVASSDFLDVDRASLAYDQLEEFSAKTAMSLSDIVNKVKNTIQNVKKNAPSLNYNLSELLKTDVLDLDGISRNLSSIVDTLNTEDNKAKEPAPYKYTKSTINASELDKLAQLIAKRAADEYRQMFDQSEDNGYYWNVLKTEAANYLVQMEPMIRSRFVKLIERYGADMILKLSPRYSRASFTAADMNDLGMWDRAIQQEMHSYISSEEFKKNLVIATMGLKIFPEQIETALAKLSKNDVWKSLYNSPDSSIVGTSWIHGFNLLFLRYLGEENEQIKENEPFLQKVVSNLLATHATDFVANK